MRGLHVSGLYAGGYGGGDRLNGLSVGGLVARQQGLVRGGTIGGLASMNGSVEGGAIGGALVVAHELKGAAIAGAVTIQRGPTASVGAAIAGGVNVATAPLT